VGEGTAQIIIADSGKIIVPAGENEAGKNFVSSDGTFFTQNGTTMTVIPGTYLRVKSELTNQFFWRQQEQDQ
jgi:hypothetical protein